MMMKSYYLKNALLTFFVSIINTSTYSQIDINFWMGKLSSTENNNNIYANVSDKLYKLNQNNWVEISDLTSYGLNEIKVDQDNNVWAFYDSKIMFSNDQGYNWQIIQSPANFNIKGEFYGDDVYVKSYYSIHKKNRNNIHDNWVALYNGNEKLEDLAIAEDGTLYVSKYNFEIIKSVDGGQNWSETGWKDMRVSSTPGELNAKHSKLFVGTYWTGCYFSEDRGETWIRSKGLPERGVSKIRIFGDNIYVLSKDGERTWGIFYSNDGGANFILINSGLSIWSQQWIDEFTYMDGKFIMGAGHRGFFSTPDNGISWNELNNGHNNIKPHHIHKIQLDKEGAIWTLMSSKGIGQRIGYGILKSQGGREFWTERSWTLEDKLMTLEDMLVLNNDKVIVSGYQPGTVHVSEDSGITWKLIDLSIWNSVGTYYGVGSTISNLIAKDDNVIYGGTYWDGIIRSIDGGNTWEFYNNGIDLDAGVSSIAITNEKLFAIVENQAYYYGIYSKKNDEAWKRVNGIKLTYITNLDDSLYGFHENRIFFSDDSGVNWQDFSKGIPENCIINSLIVFNNKQSISSERFIIASTSVGVFISPYANPNFELISSKMANTITQNGETNEIILGMVDGIDYLEIGDYISLGINNLDLEKDGTVKIYPNPGSQFLNVQSDRQSIERVEIYSIQGKKVGIFNDNFSFIPMKNLVNGVYLIRVYTHEGKIVKKFIKQ